MGKFVLGFNSGYASARNARRIVVVNTHSHYSRAISMAGTAIDPFESLRSRMPKESFDLLVSNVDPSTVSAADLVINFDHKLLGEVCEVDEVFSFIPSYGLLSPIEKTSRELK